MRRLPLAACIAVALQSVATGAAAQPAATGGAPEALQDVTVTAQFRAQRQQDTPLAVTSMKAEALEARGVVDLSQLSGFVPNTLLLNGQSIMGTAMGAQIRGIGQFDFNPAYEPGVGIHVDGVYMPTLTGALLDLLDVERIEVLRGPQGTLSGRNSLGGAVHLHTRTPYGETEGSLQTSVGSNGLLGVRASGGFRIDEDWSARVALVHRTRDGYVRQLDYGCDRPNNPQGIAATRAAGDCEVARLGGEDYTAARAKVRYARGAVDLVLSADISRTDQTNPAEVLTLSRIPDFLCGKDCTYADYRLPAGAALLGSGTPPRLSAATLVPNRQIFDGHGLSANLNVELSPGLDLQSITGYRGYRASFGTDDDFSAQSNGATGNNRLGHDFFSQELRLNGRSGRWLDWTVGGFLSRQQTTYRTEQDIRYIVTGSSLQFVGDDVVDAGSQAFYATAILHATPTTNLTTGVRYTTDYKDYTFSRRNFDGTINAYLDPVGAAMGSGYYDPVTGARALDGAVARYRGSHFDWRLSLDHRIAPGLMGYGTVSTGFRGGGVSARPFNATQAVNGAFSPETVRAFELGAKGEWLDRRLRVHAAAFVNRYQDVQMNLRDCAAWGGGPCGIIANAGDSRLQGFEIEAAFSPVAGLSFDAMASRVDSRWLRLDPRVGTSVTLDDPATSAPTSRWALGAQYAHALGDLGSLVWRYDQSWTGERFLGRAYQTTPYMLPGYRLANARVAWRNPREDLELALVASNLFDDYYYLTRTDAIANFSGTAYQRIGRPRELALVMTLRLR